MISQQARDELRQHTKKGDYKTAAKIYEQTVNRTIGARYLQKFIEGEKNPSGRPGCHQPLKMFEAVAQAVHRRQMAEQESTVAAQQILKDKIRQPQ